MKFRELHMMNRLLISENVKFREIHDPGTEVILRDLAVILQCLGCILAST